MQKNKILILFIVILSIIFWAFFSFLFLNYSEKNNINYLENKIINISKKVSPSIVSIIEEKNLDIFEKNKFSILNKQIWWGTGFFINKDWVIITNNHVVKNKNSKYIIILNNWKKYNSKIIYSDKKSDIALLKIMSTEGFSPLPLNFIDNNNLKIWQFVIAIWNTLSEFNNSVSFWIISWLNRKIENNYINLENLIQTDANINPWNSGWPLINLDWKVIWINTIILNWNKNIWFSIKINKDEINKILDKIKKDN